MLRAALYFSLFWGALAIADGPGAQPAKGLPEGGGAAQQGGPVPGGLGVKVWDDRVFDLTPKEAAQPQISKEGRVIAEEPDYNTEQRQQWLDACAPMRDKDAQAYRDCYANQKAGSAKKRRQDFDNVERRQAQPNSVPLVDEQRDNTR